MIAIGIWKMSLMVLFRLVSLFSRDRNNKICRCCGKGGLHWKQVENKWLLHNSDGIHKCEKNLYNPKLIKD